ncbi:PAS domain S-box protein [bacterium]|nr:PAS domain S-box protein [bacterium]
MMAGLLGWGRWRYLRCQQALHRSRNLLHRVQRLCHTGVYEYHCTDGSFHGSGWLPSLPVNDLKLEQIIALVHPDDLDQLDQTHAALKRATVGEEIEPSKYRLLVDGQIRHVLVFAEVLENSQGYRAIVQDVTDREQTLAQSQESQARYEALVHHSIQGITLVQNDRVVYVNPAVCVISGYSEEECKARTLAQQYELIHPEDRPGLLERKSRFEAGEAVEGHDEIRILAKDGQWRWIRSQTKWFTLNGRPARLNMMINVTDQKLAEASLREREKQLEMFVEHCPAAVAMVDCKMRYLAVSQRWKEDYRLGPEDLVGLSHYAVFPDLPERWKEVHQRCLAGACEKAEVEAFPRSDGSTDWIRWEIRPWLRADLSVGGIMILSEVITARQEAELALQASETNYRTLLQCASDAILVTNSQARVLESNLAGCRLFGFSRDEFSHLTLADLVADAEIDRLPLELARLQDGGVVTTEWTCRRKDGSLFSGEINATVLPDRRLMGTVRDITRRKQADDRIRQLNRLYAILSDINQTIVREHDPQVVLQSACQISIEKGGFGLAWIGLHQPSNGHLEVVAHAGADPETLQILKHLVEGDSPNCYFTHHALSTGQPCICNDVALDVHSAAWRSAALQRNYRAMASLPLKAGAQVVGTFNLYAAESEFFTPDEMNLLDELAMDLSFSLEVARREGEKRAAEARHARQREELIALTGQSGLVTGDVEAAMRQIVESAATTLDLARASIWRFHEDGSALQCADMFDSMSRSHSSGMVMVASDFLRDSQALVRAEQISVDEEVQESHVARLDVPIYVGGQLKGVLCQERRGSPRNWSTDEKTFAVAMSNLVSLSLESWQRRQAEEALHESEVRFRQVAENIQEVFWLTDLAKGQMLYVSPAYEKIWGRSCASLYASPKDWFDAIHADDRQRVRRAAESKQVIGEYNEWYRIVRPDGSVRWIHDRGFPVCDLNGNVVRIVGTAEDVTDQRQLEEQFRQSQKQEAIGQLAGGVAHDFNNILAVILIQTELSCAVEGTPHEVLEGLQEIHLAAQRAANLTRQLLAFSRRQTMQSQILDLNEIVAGLSNMLRRIVGEDVRVHLALSATPLQLRADAGMLDQVVMNLVVNARDAMPNGGQLTLETGLTHLTAQMAATHSDSEARAGGYACLGVSDTGTGIAPEVLSRMFDPFFTTKEPGKGTGLGLATVFGIVRQHHGIVDVKSEIGKGTTFQVLLPMTDRVESHAEQEPATPRSVGGRETILLVEDDPAVRLSTRALLERAGYTVIEAPDGVQALRIASERCHEAQSLPIQLLLTDMVLPEGISGRELARRFQEVNPQLPILFTSGYSPEIAGKEFTLLAGQRFLPKPASPQLLLETVRRSLDDFRPA